MKNYRELSDYDMFGYNIGLYFNGNIKEGTLFGIIFTIIYIISFIVVTIYYIIETLFQKCQSQRELNSNHCLCLFRLVLVSRH